MNYASINSLFSATISLIIMVLVAYVGSLFTWQIVNQQDENNPFISPIAQSNNNSIEQGNLLSIYPLFGVPPVVKVTKKRRPQAKKREKVRAVAPKVKLKLRGILSGVESYAIIEVSGDQGVYAEGDNISYLYILEISSDYVVFDDDGIEHKVYVSDESVSIGGGERSQHSSANQAQPDYVSRVSNNDIDNNALPTFVANLSFKEKKALQDLKKTLRTNPLQALGKVNAFPYRESGKLVGYQVTPGSERVLFKNAGLQAGDIILDINGEPLSEIKDFTRGMKLMEQLGQTDALDLLINRRGIEQRVYINIEQ